MSTGSGASSTSSAVGSAVGRAAARVAAVHHIGTPRSVASTPSSRASTAPLSSRLPSAGGSVGSLIARFSGLGYQGDAAPPLAPARRERQLSVKWRRGFAARTLR